MKELDRQKKALLEDAIQAINEELSNHKENLVKNTSKDFLLKCKSELENFSDFEKDPTVVDRARQSGMGRAIIDCAPLDSLIINKILLALDAFRD